MTTVEERTEPAGQEAGLVLRNPCDGTVVGTVPIKTDRDVADAITRARSHQRPWAETNLRERARHLRRIRASLARRADELADTISAETGKPAYDAMAEVLLSAVLFAHADSLNAYHSSNS